MDSYCKLFIDVPYSKAKLIEEISRIVKGSISRNRIDADWGEIDVEDNEFFDEHEKPQGSDAFLCFKYYLDIDVKEGVELAAYMSAIGELLKSCWDSGLRAVAACDFEDQLPKQGGCCEK
jgi:hypothetical protein